MNHVMIVVVFIVISISSSSSSVSMLSYIYIYRERERCTYTYTYMYVQYIIYIYIYIYEHGALRVPHRRYPMDGAKLIVCSLQLCAEPAAAASREVSAYTQSPSQYLSSQYLFQGLGCPETFC